MHVYIHTYTCTYVVYTCMNAYMRNAYLLATDTQVCKYIHFTYTVHTCIHVYHCVLENYYLMNNYSTLSDSGPVFSKAETNHQIFGIYTFVRYSTIRISDTVW